VTDLTGRTLGPYQLVERIGEGGMAVVYKGYQAPLGRYVAIKVLRGELTRDASFVTRFRREALAVAKLDHPNILHVYDAGVIDGVYYIAMGYTAGGSLRDQVDRGPLEVDLAVSIAAQLADALDHAHEQGLVHRDVKPSNILLSPNMRPLLADFGIARLLHEASRLTRTGVSIGTPEYMAPEHALMQPIDGRTDLYALGAVLYEMLCGEVPFTAATAVVTLYRHVNDVPQPLRQRNGDVPNWLEGVVDRALAKRPQDRYQRARDLAEDLRQRRAPSPAEAGTITPRGLPLPSERTTTRDRLSRPRRLGQRPVRLILGAIGLLLVALVLGGVLLFGGGGGDVDVSPRAAPTASALTPAGALATATVTPTVTPTPSSSPTISPTPSSSPTGTPTGTPTPTATVTPSPLPSATPAPTQAPAGQPEPTQEGTAVEPQITRKPTPTKANDTQPVLTAGPRPTSTSDTSGTTP
jgi:serine/threonine protein kinase